MTQPIQPSSAFPCVLPCFKNGFPYSLSILEHAPVLVWHAGPDSKCDWFNATWLAFTGRNLDQELGDGWTKGVHPEDLDACLRSYLEAFKERRSFELEYRLRHHSGEYRWIIDIGTPLYIEGGGFSGYIGYCFDSTDRKRAEHALAESEERWQFALKASEDGVWDWNLETNVAYLSKRYHEMFGYQPGEIPPTHECWVESIHPDDRQRVITKVNDLLRGEVAYYLDEHRIRCKDGIYKWVIDRGKVMTRKADGTPLRVVGTYTDLSAFKYLEESLIESEQRWQFALEGSRDGVWDWNVQTDEAYFSPRWKEMLGYQPDEIGASSTEWSNRVHPDDLPKAMEALQKHFRGETPSYLCEHRVRTKDGFYRLILTRGKVMTWTPDGKPLRMVGTHTDITDLKRLQESLVQSEVQFSQAFMHAPIGMALAEIDGRLLKVNPALCAILKYSEQELLDLKFQNLIHQDDVSNDVPQIVRLLNGELQLYETEKRFLTKDGDVVWVQLNISLVCDAQGRPAYFIKQMQDITERKRAQERLRRSEKQFASFMDNLLGYAWIKDQAGIYQYANKKFADAMASRIGPGFVLRGKPDAEILPPENAEICRRNDLKVLRTGRPAESLEEFGSADKRRVLLVSKFPLKLGQDGEISVGGLAIDITARVRAEHALRKSRERLKTLIEERERLSQDLHDHSIQALYAVGMDLCECKDLLAAPSGKQKVGLVLVRSVDRINEVIRELRGHLRKKDPSNGKMPDDMAQAIRQMVRQVSESGNIRIKATVQRRAVMALDQMQVAHVFAIIREGLSNIVRHARARHAQVSLVLTQPTICVEIADDGVGGAACQDRRKGQKLGLHNIRARAARMKAEYTLTSPQGGGTRIRLLIPKARRYGA